MTRNERSLRAVPSPSTHCRPAPRTDEQQADDHPRREGQPAAARPVARRGERPSLIARDGLAAVAPWLALAWVVGIVPMTLALIRPSPAALGMAPDGDAIVPGSPPVAPVGMARATAIRTRGRCRLRVHPRQLLVLIPVLLVEAFGVRDYAGIYSANQLLATLGIAAGPILMGVLRDATGGYATPLLLAAGASAFATAVHDVAPGPEVDDAGLPRVRAAQA